MKSATVPGATSQIRHVFIQDSTSTAGAGKTALAFGDITAYYVRAGGTLTALTMETIATLGTWASTGDNYLGFKLVHDTNAPGIYELHLPNNILAAGAAAVVIQLRATGAAPCNLEIQLANAPADALALSGDATAADNLEAACDGTTYNIGGGAVVAASVTGAVGSVTGAVGSVTGAVGSVTAGVTVTTNNDKTGYTASTVSDKTGYSLTQTFPTNFADLNISATTGLVRPDMANASGNYAGTVATVTTLTNLPAAAALEATLTNMKGATFDTATDSLEALRNRGDEAWTTATGFSTHSAADVKTAIEAAGSHLALILADTGTDGVVLSTATKQAIADALLSRSRDGGADGGAGEKVADALSLLASWAVVGSNLVGYNTAGVAVITLALTTDAAAEPVTSAGAP